MMTTHTRYRIAAFRRATVLAVLMSVALPVRDACAQNNLQSSRSSSHPALAQLFRSPVSTSPISQAIARVRFDEPVSGREGAVSQLPRRPRPRGSSKQRAWAIVGAFGGMVAGGYIGAMIEGDCRCDDPGLSGFVIGAPIGMIAGGVLGYKLAR
jgi:hypothetical protein